MQQQAFCTLLVREIPSHWYNIVAVCHQQWVHGSVLRVDAVAGRECVNGKLPWDTKFVTHLLMMVHNHSPALSQLPIEVEFKIAARATRSEAIVVKLEAFGVRFASSPVRAINLGSLAWIWVSFVQGTF